MPLVLADRVVEQTTTQGTNNFELIGTGTGYQAFSVVGNGSTVYYTAEGVNDDGTLTGQWEVGQGVYNAGVLSRDTILSSSTGSKVSFSAGQKNVFIDLPSEKAVVLDDTDKVSGYAITGGSINNTPIGATTASTGRFTSVTTPSVTASVNSIDIAAVGAGQVYINQGQTGAFGLVLNKDIGATNQSARLFFDSSNGTSSIRNNGGNILTFATAATLNSASGTTQFVVNHTASAVNYVQVTGAATTNKPTISAQGSDTNINVDINSKGTGFITFNSGTSPILRMLGSASTANYMTVTGSATNIEPVLSVAGTDTNISLALQSKGTGSIDLASGSTGVNVSNGTTVTAITRTGTGSLYTSFPSIAISAPNIAGGVQATASMFKMGASNATIAGGGTGYTVGDTITVVGGTPVAGAATYTVSTVSAGVITAVTPLNFAEYSVLPTNPVSVTGGTGTGATLNLTYFVPSGGWNITNAGSGYTSQPTVTFSGGGGSGAAAYATVGSAPTIRGLGNNLNFATASGNGFAILDAGNTSGFLWQAIGGSGNAIFRSSGATQTGLIQTSGTGGLAFQTNNGVSQMQVTHTASAVNYVQVTGAPTTGQPRISAQGSDASIALRLASKGTFNIQLENGSSQAGFMVSPVGAANYLQATSANTNNAPVLSSQGTDTNIDLALTPKGTGLVRFGTYTNTVSTIAGYIEIRDAGGTIRRLAVVS